MSTEAQKKASNKFNKSNTTLINIRLNHKTDADIIDYLGSMANKAGYIKGLIRQDMKDR